MAHLHLQFADRGANWAIAVSNRDAPLQSPSMTPCVRPAAVAGLFYPGRPDALRANVASLLKAGPPRATRRAPKLLVVPHAGYEYSGPIAASGYAGLQAARDVIRRVVLLGPAHRVPVRGLALPEADAFETPLAEVPLDREAIAALADLPQVARDDRPHELEHALEVQLPFLQCVLGRFALVPLLVGKATPEQVATVIERLWGGDETLVVVSSDLSHDLPYREAQRSDDATVRRVLDLDARLGPMQACGASPLNGALLVARRHGLVPRLLDLRNSGDTAGDRSRVVGYCAIAFERPESDHSAHDAAAAADAARDDEAALGTALLVRARNAIAGALGRPTLPEPDHPRLAADGATFVTLRRDGELRGCIGRLSASRPLDEDVRANARAAAFEDPRCKPCTAGELDRLSIEVSLLGESRDLAIRDEADALRQLRPGVDGVTLRWRDRQATLLPQMWQQLPQPREFLSTLKRKAGLPGDFWSDEVQLSVYPVRKFAEAALPGSAAR